MNRAESMAKAHEQLEAYNALRHEENQVWRAILDGRYDEAIRSYSDLLSSRDQMNLHMNRGIARLMVGDYEGAECDFRDARVRPNTLPDKLISLKVGVALWLRELREEACQDWVDQIVRTRNGEITHTDYAGGVEAPALLWWASAHPSLAHWRRTAESELKARWKTKRCQRSRWPGSVVPFLLGMISEAELVAAAAEESPTLRRRQTGVAKFYIGAVALSCGDNKEYRQELRMALELMDVVVTEYHLARYELTDRDTE